MGSFAKHSTSPRDTSGHGNRRRLRLTKRKQLSKSRLMSVSVALFCTVCLVSLVTLLFFAFIVVLSGQPSNFTPTVSTDHDYFDIISPTSSKPRTSHPATTAQPTTTIQTTSTIDKDATYTPFSLFGVKTRLKARLPPVKRRRLVLNEISINTEPTISTSTNEKRVSSSTDYYDVDSDGERDQRTKMVSKMMMKILHSNTPPTPTGTTTTGK